MFEMSNIVRRIKGQPFWAQGWGAVFLFLATAVLLGSVAFHVVGFAILSWMLLKGKDAPSWSDTSWKPRPWSRLRLIAGWFLALVAVWTAGEHVFVSGFGAVVLSAVFLSGAWWCLIKSRV